MMKQLLLLLILSCLFAGLITAGRSTRRIRTNTCGQFTCPAGDLCCRNNYIGIYRQQCYNPSTHRCVVDGYKPTQNCLCGIYDGCCNQICYDARRYLCDNGRIKLKPTTPPNCGQFNCPSGNQCCSNNVIGIYRQQCYNPATHHCIPDDYTPSQNCLCGIYDGCCNRICYDKNLYKCYNGRIVPKTHSYYEQDYCTPLRLCLIVIVACFGARPNAKQCPQSQTFQEKGKTKKLDCYNYSVLSSTHKCFCNLMVDGKSAENLMFECPMCAKNVVYSYTYNGSQRLSTCKCP